MGLNGFRYLFWKYTTYTVLDLHLGYKINDIIKANFTVSNLFNSRHTEIIGGPSMGRVAILRFTTIFNPSFKTIIYFNKLLKYLLVKTTNTLAIVPFIDSAKETRNKLYY